MLSLSRALCAHGHRAADTVNGEKIEIIAASIRGANHVAQAALMGADIATVPFGILKKCVQHPLTDRGLDAFMKDWEKVQSARARTLMR